MKPSQAEILLQIAENTYDDGDEVISEMRRIGLQHARRVLSDKEMLERALEINKQDQARFAQHMPHPARDARPEQDQQEPHRRPALGNQGAPRAVLAPLKKVGNEQSA